jgi:hypothetical protein
MYLNGICIIICVSMLVNKDIKVDLRLNNLELKHKLVLSMI